jgi:hypothetical protein
MANRMLLLDYLEKAWTRRQILNSIVMQRYIYSYSKYWESHIAHEFCLGQRKITYQTDEMRTSSFLEHATRKWERVPIILLLADTKHRLSSWNSHYCVISHANPEVSLSVRRRQLRPRLNAGKWQFYAIRFIYAPLSDVISVFWVQIWRAVDGQWLQACGSGCLAAAKPEKRKQRTWIW